MDTKAARRDFYKHKLYLGEKLDQKYTTQRFPEDIQTLLDDFIPKATLKQLSKFMDKKYHRIIKTFPEVEKALKKVLKNKINKLPEQIKNAQIKKFLNHLKEKYPNYDFETLPDGKINMNPNQKGAIEDKKIHIFENTTINIPINLEFRIQTLEKNTKGIYTVIHQSLELYEEVVFGTTAQFEVGETYKFEVKNGNFEREANNMLEKFNAFMVKIENLENPQE